MRLGLTIFIDVQWLNEETNAALLEALNQIWLDFKPPTEWLEIKVLLIPKKNKNFSDIRNFRLILLINVSAKLLNSMAKSKLVHLPEKCYAYRKDKSTRMCLN